MKQDKAQLEVLKIISEKSDFILPKRKNNKMAKELERALKAGLVKKNIRLKGRNKDKEEIFYTITNGGLSKLNQIK